MSTLQYSNTSEAIEIPNTIESMINQLFISTPDDITESSYSETDIKLEDTEDLNDAQTEDTETQNSFFLRNTETFKPQTMNTQNSFFTKNLSDFSLCKTRSQKMSKTTCFTPNILPSNTFTYPTPSQQINISTPIVNEHLDSNLYELDYQLKISKCISYQLLNIIAPHLLNIIKTQSGSRILQTHLPKTSLPIIKRIYDIISPFLHILLLDPYANYFCLKLFYCLPPSDRISYLSLISPFIPNLSINKVATYPIQCIIANLITPHEKQIIINSIMSNIETLSLDIYGTHVVEKALICIDAFHTKPIVQFILDNLLSLSSHVNGLCIAKRLLILSSQSGLYRNELIAILNKYCLMLIQNPYGNYALQIVIENWNEEDVWKVISPLCSHYGELSIMKYSSNVIERCLEKSQMCLYQFIKETCNGNGMIRKLIKNNYGNYVVQTALKNAKCELKFKLIKSIEDNLDVLGEKKLINKWKMILTSNLLECVNRNGNYL